MLVRHNRPFASHWHELLVPARSPTRRWQDFRTSNPQSRTPLRSASVAAIPLAQQQASSPSFTVSSQIQNSILKLQETLRRDIGGAQYWSNRLEEAHLDLIPRTKRVAIYGDSLAAPENVVAALLQTPFSDTHEIARFINERQRHEAAEVLKFSFLSQPHRDGFELGLPSGWLRQSCADLYEISGRHALAYLLRSDIKVIVVDPYRLTDTEQLRAIPAGLLLGSHIVVNGPLPPSETPDRLRRRLMDQIGAPFTGSVTFCSAHLAIEAYSALATNGTVPGPRAVNKYQELFLASGIGNLQTELIRAVTSHETIASTQLTLDLAVRHVQDTIQVDSAKAEQALRTVRDLRNASEASARRAKHLSVASRSIEGGTIQGSVGASGWEAAARIEFLLKNRLSWLSVLFRLRVDDIAEELDREIATAFQDVEQQLVYEAGQLYQIQQQLSAEADKLIRQSPPPFGSAVLTNRLSTLSLSVPAVEPDALLTPIKQRRQQLRADVVPPLQAYGRILLLQTYLGALGGSVAAWVAYVPPVEALSSATALSFALLSSVLAVYWGQIRWHKAQRGFWRSWRRCTEMLGKDLHRSFDSAVDAMVVAKPQAAASGLEELAKKRLSVLECIERQLPERQ